MMKKMKRKLVIVLGVVLLFTCLIMGNNRLNGQSLKADELKNSQSVGGDYALQLADEEIIVAGNSFRVLLKGEKKVPKGTIFVVSSTNLLGEESLEGEWASREQFSVSFGAGSIQFVANEELNELEIPITTLSPTIGSSSFAVTVNGKQQEALEIEAVKQVEPVLTAEAKLVPTKGSMTRMVTPVSTWGEFVAAVLDSTTTEIDLQKDITNPSTASIGTLNKSLTIKGNGFKLDVGKAPNLTTPALTLGDVAGSLSLSNVIISGKAAGAETNTDLRSAIFFNSSTANWTIDLNGVSTPKETSRRFIYNPNGAVTVSGGVNDLHQEVSTWVSTLDTVNVAATKLIEAKSLVVTGGATLNSETGNYLFYSKVANSLFVVEQGSLVNSKSTNTGSIAIDAADALIELTDSSKVNMANSIPANRDGATSSSLTINGNNATYNILNDSSLTIVSDYQPVIVMQSQGGVFNIDQNSSLIGETKNERTATRDLSATMRFRFVGNMTFNISNSSLLSLKSGPGSRMQTLRMYGNSNKLNISGGSEFYIDNQSTGTDGAVNYTTGSNALPNSFYLLDKGSRVRVNSTNVGIASANSIQVLGEKDTEFNVLSAGVAMEFPGTSHFEANNMYYYDFANSKGASVFSGRAFFRSINSDASFWLNKTPHTAMPDYDWSMANYGTNNGIGQPVVPSFPMEFLPSVVGQTFTSESGILSTLNTTATRLDKMSRISGNNASPIVDELRVPTDADQYVYGHVVVPEGYIDNPRDAWDNEIMVEVEITPPTGASYKKTGTTKGQAVYGEPLKQGMFQIPTNEGELLKTGTKVKVLRAWRGGNDPTSPKAHVGLPGDDSRWVTEAVVTEDVTPPSKAQLTEKVSNGTKQLNGTSDENQAKVFIKVNDQWLKDSQDNLISTVVVDGKWQLDLPQYLTKEDAVDIYLKDQSIVNKVVNPPLSYTDEPDGEKGNLNVTPVDYDKFIGYHDALKTPKDQRFNEALRVETTDIIPSKPVITKTVSSDTLNGKDQITQVGTVLTYTIALKNNDALDSGKIWSKAKLRDVLPIGLKIDLASLKQVTNDASVTPTSHYNEETRELLLELGDLKPQETVEVSFKTTVTVEAVDEILTNTAWGIGDSPQETPFVPGPINEASEHVIIKESSAVDNPGGTVAGQLKLESAPGTIDFGEVSIIDFQKTVGADQTNVDSPLVVSDTRKAREKWDITAQIVQEMSNGEDVYEGALKYVYRNKELTLEGDPKMIYQNETNKADGLYNISESWQKSETADGIKLRLDPTKAPKTTGTYEGIIKWTLRHTIP